MPPPPPQRFALTSIQADTCIGLHLRDYWRSPIPWLPALAYLAAIAWFGSTTCSARCADALRGLRWSSGNEAELIYWVSTWLLMPFAVDRLFRLARRCHLRLALETRARMDHADGRSPGLVRAAVPTGVYLLIVAWLVLSGGASAAVPDEDGDFAWPVILLVDWAILHGMIWAAFLGALRTAAIWRLRRAAWR